MFTGMRGNTGALVSENILIPTVNIPLIQDIPVLGDILSGHSVLTYLAFLFVFLMWMLLYKTLVGLSIRAVGENEHAAESVGIKVRRIQYTALAISGSLAGLGGAFMSTIGAKVVRDNMRMVAVGVTLVGVTVVGLGVAPNLLAYLFVDVANGVASAICVGPMRTIMPRAADRDTRPQSEPVSLSICGRCCAAKSRSL